jgi:O-antigen biosynthesis protein
MIPIRDLQSLSESTAHWQATGCDPQFLIPCALPAGWVRIRLRLRSDVRGRMEWYTLDAADVPLERADYFGTAAWDFYVHLRQPVSGLRFDPLDVEGTFVVEDLHIEPQSAVRMLARALRTKLGLLWRYGKLTSALRNGLRMLWRRDFDAVREKLFGGLPRPTFQSSVHANIHDLYDRWRRARGAIRPQMTDQSGGPLLSLIIPCTHLSDSELNGTVVSVLDQVYPRWELWLIHSGDESIGDPCRDSRVKLAPAHAVLESVAGHAFALLNAGDILHEEALWQMARAFRDDPKLDMVYSDEDRLLPNGHAEPQFKPAWSPELLLSRPYTGRLSFYRTSLVRQWGGFDLNAEVDLELARQMAQLGARVGHIPDVLYHSRRDFAADPATQPVPFVLNGRPRVSILIPTAYRTFQRAGQSITLLARCLESIRDRTTYPHYEILVADNGQPPAAIDALYSTLRVRRFAYALPFNWAAAMNQVAAQASGEYLVLLDDDTEVLTPDWLERLLEYGQRPGVGAVGAKLVFPDGRLQHAGVALLNGYAIHPFAGLPADHPGYLGSIQTPRNCSAVTSACMLTSAAVFRAVGGFRESFALYYNDIDYCLRLNERGFRVVYTPYATMRHHEAATKTALPPLEQQTFQELWADRLTDDPYYNPNLSADARDCRIETNANRIQHTRRGVRYGWRPDPT